MRRMLLLITGTCLWVNVVAQENSFNKNTGTSYISVNDFTNVLLEKNYNSISDITAQNNAILYNWRLKTDKEECELCNHVYADLTPIWDSENFQPLEVSMRYTIRPSTGNVNINYTYNIINSISGNVLITKVTEVNSGIEKIINIHKTNENKSVLNSIKVVPGRIYYIDIVANYGSEAAKTIFQFDSLSITEQVLSGSIVFNNCTANN